MSDRPFLLPHGLSARICVSFLVIALLPALLAGLVGIHFSLEALEFETLTHLQSELDSRADALARLVDQLASALNDLSSTSNTRQAADAMAADGQLTVMLRKRLEDDFAAFASAYPFIEQIRLIGAEGFEKVRVDRRGHSLAIAPESALQDTWGRYYVRQALATAPGRLYVSPLDLDREFGQVEDPARPVVRFAVVVADSGGTSRGVLIINLRTEFVLRNIRSLDGSRGGEAYLFDRSGRFLKWSPERLDQVVAMRPIDSLRDDLSPRLANAIMEGRRDIAASGDRIIAFAPVTPLGDPVSADRGPLRWSIAIACPEHLLFASAFNLYPLYGVLALALTLTAAGGVLMSRRLLLPLSRLKEEAQHIAGGNFDRRVEIRGDDEIADLGVSFNRMAGRIEQMVGDLAERGDELEALVAARTEQLALERRNLDGVLQHAADGILGLDRERRIGIANQAACRILGMRREALLSTPLGAVLPDIADILQRDGDARRCRIIRETRQLELALSPIGPAGGPASGHVLLLRDVTEEVRMQAARREQDRQMFQNEKVATLGELAMGIAHEIGNALGGMKAVVQALQMDADLDARRREHLGRLENEMDRLTDFLRPFHGFEATEEAEPRPCALDEAVNDVLLWTRKEARKQNIVIDLDLAHDLPKAWADPSQLKQVLLNLVVNAIHALPTGGRLSISARAAPASAGHVEIVIADDGAGIAPDLHGRIFEPLFTTRSQGTGLGLAIVRRIAREHGVLIDLASRPGAGTRIKLTWPCQPDRPPTDQAG